MNKISKSILFVLGPSGAGKSTVAAWAAEDLGVLHLEIDRYPEGDGIDMADLRMEWDEFWTEAKIQPLADALAARAAEKPGIIVSFPSGVVLSDLQLAVAHEAGVKVAILYGTGAECVTAFLQRETAVGGSLDAEHWVRYNMQAYANFSLPYLAPYRVLAFEKGQFRNRTELVAELGRRIG